MMNIFSRIAEEQIKEAIERGEFDHLPGRGKPLVIDEMSHVPAELRASYLMMKNGGYVPEEVQLSKEIVNLQELLRLARDDSEADAAARRKLTEKQLRLRMLMEQRGFHGNAAFAQYEHRIRGKMEGDN